MLNEYGDYLAIACSEPEGTSGETFGEWPADEWKVLFKTSQLTESMAKK